jgi:hypothetical protein
VRETSVFFEERESAAHVLRYEVCTKNFHTRRRASRLNKQRKGKLMRKYLWIPAAALSALLGTACMGMNDRGMRSGGMGSSSDMSSGGMGSSSMGSGGGMGEGRAGSATDMGSSTGGGDPVSPNDPKRGTGGS